MVIFKYSSNTYNDEIVFNGKPNVVLRLLNYVFDPLKTSEYFSGARGVYGNLEQIEPQFYRTQILFNKTNGEKLSHLIVTFSKDLNFNKYDIKYAADILADYIGQTHQLFYSAHINRKKNLHIHFIINSVSFLNGEYYKENTTNVKKYYALLSSAFAIKLNRPNLGGCHYDFGDYFPYSDA